MRNSLFLKILAAIFAVLIVVTVISLVAENGKKDDDTKVNTPTEEVTTVADPEQETAGPLINIGGELVLIATNASDNTSFAYSVNEGTGSVRYAFVVQGLKANTNYRLTYSISDAISNAYHGIKIMHQTPGMASPDEWVVSGSADLYNNSIAFTTNSAETQYVNFYVAEGDYDADTMDIETLAANVMGCVTFTLYEVKG